MKETFPIKRRGDALEAEHINKLSKIAAEVSAGNRGSNLNAFGDVLWGLGRFIIRQIIVTYDNGDGTYQVGLRYFDHTASEWKTAETGESLLDATESGLSFGVDEKLVAYWNRQRAAYMPFGTGGVILKIGKTDDRISVNGRGTVSIWAENESGDVEDTDENQEDVRHDWITGGVDLPANTEVVMGYFSGESLWRIIGAECPPE